MVHREQLAQTIRKTLAGQMRERFIPQPLLPVCCVCGLLRDETGSSADGERWVTQRTYRRTYGVNPADCPLTHTYCPECFTKFENTVRQNFRQIEMSL